MSKHNPFKRFHSSPEIIRLAVMLYIRFPLSLRNVEDLLHERGIDVSHETINKAAEGNSLSLDQAASISAHLIGSPWTTRVQDRRIGRVAFLPPSTTSY